MTRIQDFSTLQRRPRSRAWPSCCRSRPRIAVGMGTCGTGNGAEGVYHAFADAIDQRGLDIQLARVGCFGFCAQEPLVNVLAARPAAGDSAPRAAASDVDEILDDVADGQRPGRAGALQDRGVGPHHRRRSSTAPAIANIPLWNEVPFFKGQKKIVLRNCGLISPDDIEEYIAVGGYQALYKVLIDSQPGRGDRADQGLQAARPRRRRASPPARNGNSCARPRPTRSTSSATRTKATPAPT